MSNLKKLVIASHNKKKTEEIVKILKDYNIEAVTIDEIELPDVEETGTTFEENALLKAHSAANATGLPSLADDSGLCVDALDGRPGVYSARYGDHTKLLEEMSNIPFGRRTAKFVSVLALVIPNEGVHTFEGEVKGFILTEPKGTFGFGYDPVFLPEGEQVCFAEMLPEQKALISHRGRAINKFISHIKCK